MYAYPRLWWSSIAVISLRITIVGFPGPYWLLRRNTIQRIVSHIVANSQNPIRPPNRLSAISGPPAVQSKLKIPPSSFPYQMSPPRPTISPSRTPLLSHSPALPEESDGRRMKVLCLNTESWTREDVRRTITFVSAVLVGLGRSVECYRWR